MSQDNDNGAHMAHLVPLDLSTTLTALGGGALIGLSATLLYLSHGRVAGVSGILAGLVTGPESGFRLWFLLGLLLAGAGLAIAWPAALPAATGGPSLAVLVPAGLLVGFGTRLSNGCTRGHGVCGLGRLSKRSLVATLTFMLTAGLTVFVTRHLVAGGAP